jgi:hypothetical protein
MYSVDPMTGYSPMDRTARVGETTSTHCEYELLLETRGASSSSSEEWEFSKRTRLGIPALHSWPLYTR